MKKILFSLLVFLNFVVPAFAAELKVAVAANLQYAFEELEKGFEKDSGILLTGIIGSSGKFTTQIENGAPFDVFLSADMDYPKTLYKEGLTVGEPKIYVYGTLVLWTLRDVDLSKGLAVLTEPGVRKVAMASPKTAPYGRQSVNALKNSGIYKAVQPKLVYGENIAQTNQFITSGAADAGFTAKSMVLAANMKDQGKWIEVPAQSYDTIAQGAVILKHAETSDLAAARKFFDYIFSDAAQVIWKKYGYVLPNE